MTDTLAGALEWHDAGCSVIRVALNGTKSPLSTWKQHQSERASRQAVEAWYANQHPGVGVVCGSVSGNLELLELEGRAVAEGFIPAMTAACDERGIGDTWRTLLATCAESSPSGGMHLFYRVPDGVAGNTKLAQRLAREDELNDQERDLQAKGKQVVRGLIETRGEGGFVVVAPSHGPVHDTRKPYVWLVGGPGTIPTVSGEERDLLHIAALSLDQLPPPIPVPEPAILGPRTGDPAGKSPGDDYNARGSWADLLRPHGWAVVSSDPTRTYWRRPGKTFGISAVTGGTEGDYFYSWTTSTVLPAEEAMSKFRVYAFLEHAGDFHTAAKKLKSDGYGEPAPPRERVVLTGLPAFSTNGSSAHAPQPQSAPTHTTSTLEQSDDGNALALVDTFGRVIRYCPERGRWLHWTGQRDRKSVV